MEGYYSGYNREKQLHRSILARLFDWLLLLVTIAVVVAMILTLFVPYITPSDIWLFPVLGLLAPGIYVMTIVLMLYWVIRWRWQLAVALLLLVVCGSFKVSLFFRPEIQRNHGVAKFDRSSFKVMTYNVRNFYNNAGQTSVADVVTLIDTLSPDVICLQEFNSRLADQNDAFTRLGELYRITSFEQFESSGAARESQLLVLTKPRFKVLRSGVVQAPRSSVWVDLLFAGDTIRLYNNHLRSTAINASDDRFITDKLFLSDTAREEKVRSIVRRFGANSVLRAQQADTIALAMAAVRGRRIVCGDFNDTPMSYVYRTMSRGLDDSFSVCGRGYSSTFRGFYNMLRIDYVLNSKGLEPLSYEVVDVDYSDHRPVLVRLMKTKLED